MSCAFANTTASLSDLNKSLLFGGKTLTIYAPLCSFDNMAGDTLVRLVPKELTLLFIPTYLRRPLPSDSRPSVNVALAFASISGGFLKAASDAAWLSLFAVSAALR